MPLAVSWAVLYREKHRHALQTSGQAVFRAL